MVLNLKTTHAFLFILTIYSIVFVAPTMFLLVYVYEYFGVSFTHASWSEWLSMTFVTVLFISMYVHLAWRMAQPTL